MVFSAEPRRTAAIVAVAVGVVVLLLIFLRARNSRHPVVLYTCGAYLALLHGVWLWGLAGAPMFASALGTLIVLTFPWSFSVTTNMTMAGFATLPDLLLNYARFVLGFGGLQCLLLTLFVWELKLAPRRRRKPSHSRSTRS